MLLGLARAMRAMDKKLDAAWSQRAADTPLKTPEQALILASIVEKETGRANDRAMISGVFSNRLKIGMMLQTDPTVIYGLGAKFDGNLRRADLERDGPYNTYTRPARFSVVDASADLGQVEAAVRVALRSLLARESGA